MTESQSAVYMLYHPHYDLENSSLFLQNLGTNQAYYELQFYKLAENQVYIHSGDIPTGGVEKVTPTDLTGIPEGVYSLAIVSAEPLRSVASVQRSSFTGDNLALYNGSDNGSTGSIFGPVYKDGEGVNSIIHLMNTSAISTTIQVDFYDTTGTYITQVTETITDTNTTIEVKAQDIGGLPDDYIGWAQVDSTEPVVGILESSSGQVLYIDQPLWEESVTLAQILSPTIIPISTLPRLFQSVGDGSRLRSSIVVLLNLEDSAANYSIYLYDSNGIMYSLPMPSINPGEMHLIDLQETYLPDGGVYSAIIASDYPLVVGEQTRFDNTPYWPVGSYTAPSLDYDVFMPRIVRHETNYSVISLMQIGDSPQTVNLTFMSTDNSLVVSKTYTIDPLVPFRVNALDVDQLGSDFEGGVYVSTSFLFYNQVDEYVIIENPVPTISNIDPDSTIAGSGAFTLTVNGSDFNENSFVRWNGSIRPTTYISETQLTASIMASDVVSVGIASVVVYNPSPGGGTSNSVNFSIKSPGIIYLPIVIKD